MVVVLAAWQRDLVARRAVADLQARDELQAGELLEHAVDARPSDRAARAAQRGLDLARADRARLAAEVLDDGSPRPAAAVAGLLQTAQRVVCPSGRRHQVAAYVARARRKQPTSTAAIDAPAAVPA